MATVALLVPSAIAAADSDGMSAFTGKLIVGIALGSASQIALFVALVLVLLTYCLGPVPMVYLVVAMTLYLLPPAY